MRKYREHADSPRDFEAPYFQTDPNVGITNLEPYVQISFELPKGNR
jgi:hypothetical protein